MELYNFVLYPIDLYKLLHMYNTYYINFNYFYVLDCYKTYMVFVCSTSNVF